MSKIIQVEGLCPMCGKSDISYYGGVKQSNGRLDRVYLLYSCQWPGCGFEGREYHGLEFIRHTTESGDVIEPTTTTH